MARPKRANLVLVMGYLLALACPVRGSADERVDITAMDGVQLIGDLTGTSGPGVVLVPGEHHGRQVWKVAAAAIAARGFRTLRFDLRGNGDSTGAVDVAASDRDVEGAFRYVLGRKIRPVFLVGEGSGGAAALQVASRVPVAGVVVLGAAPTASGARRVPLLVLSNPVDRDAATLSSEGLAAVLKFLGDPRSPAAVTPSRRGRP